MTSLVSDAINSFIKSFFKAELLEVRTFYFIGVLNILKRRYSTISGTIIIKLRGDRYGFRILR